MIVFLAMSMLEILIGTMSISRYGVMTVYRVIIMDLMSDIVWLIVLFSTISQAVLFPMNRCSIPSGCCIGSLVHPMS